MKHLITKTIEAGKPPALLMTSENEPGAMRLLAWFANPDARDIFDEFMRDLADAGQYRTWEVKDDGKDEPTT